MNSALYEGTNRHRRLRGTPRDEFRHGLFMAYLDLDELPGLLARSPLFSSSRPAPVRFRRADHLGDRAVPLADSVRALVHERAGLRPQGPIRLLTTLRCLGVCFNPVSFYYCFDSAGETVAAVLAHVTNTPWGETHTYVLPATQRSQHGSAAVLRGEVEKLLHVSPLMGMDHRYELRLTEPGERLSVHIASAPDAGGAPVFDATLALERRPMSSAELLRMVARHPLQGASTLARIYGHAARLRLRGARYHPHPQRTSVA